MSASSASRADKLRGRPRRLTRLFFKVPVMLHRLGFGGWESLLGLKWMLLTTIGRKSGAPHRVMVDVMGHEAATDTFYVAAAYGSQADWYRNIQANGRCRAQVGGRSFDAGVSEVSTGKTEEVAVDFYRRRPAYTRATMRLAGIKHQNEDEFRKLAREWLLLAVTPRTTASDSGGI